MSLRTKAIFLFTFVAIFPLLVYSVVAQRAAIGMLETTVHRKDEAHAASMANVIDGFISALQREFLRIAARLPKDAVRNHDMVVLGEYLTRTAIEHSRFANGFFLLDRKGTLVLSVPPTDDLIGASFSFRSYFTQTRDTHGPVIYGPYTSARTGAIVATFTAPLFSREGEFDGLLAGSINLGGESMLGGITRARFNDTGFVTIENREGKTLLSSQPENYMSPQEENEELVAGSHPMVSTGWTVSIHEAKREALAPTKELSRRAMLMLIGALSLGLAIGGLAVVEVTRPLARLKARIASISLENPHFETEGLPSTGEVGEVAGVFSLMTEKLAGGMEQERRLRAEAAAARDHLAVLFESMTDGIAATDEHFSIRECNSAFSTMFGRHVTSLQQVVADQKALDDLREEALNNPQGVASDDIQARKIDGTSFPCSFTMASISGGDQRQGRWILVFRDITTRRKMEEQLRLLTVTDGLTGMYNHRHFYQVLEKEMRRATRYHRPFSLVCFDLDGFKAVNDALGHLMGDRVLQATAQTVRSQLRTTDYGFRYGGDEFMIILTETDDTEAARAAERLRSRFKEEMVDQFSGGEQPRKAITLSLGLSRYRFGEKGEDVVRRADLAMYEAKKAGGDRIVVS